MRGVFFFKGEIDQMGWYAWVGGRWCFAFLFFLTILGASSFAFFCFSAIFHPQEMKFIARRHKEDIPKQLILQSR